MTVPPRHPYAGELVFTAFSGSHQDAIKKGLTEWGIKKSESFDDPTMGKSERKYVPAANPDHFWDVPYLTIDPADIGREYREVIRVNSQSGKGGVAYLLESEFGIELPKDMQREFGPIANDIVDAKGREVSATELKEMFWKEYVERKAPWELDTFRTKSENGKVICIATLLHNESPFVIGGQGNGPLAALVHGIAQAGGPKFEITNYREHALGSGDDAAAISYIQIKTADGKARWGAGVDTNIELASVKAVLSALNRL
jgi:2-isopropylmalate synthase